MLKASEFGEVTDFSMGRSIGSFVLYYVHSFLIGDTLIDTGTRYAQDDFLDALKGKRIKTIINTHHHEDHIGNNRIIRQKFGAKIYAPAEALKYLEKPKDIKLKLYQRIFWGLPAPSTGEPLGPKINIGKYEFEVIHTPGHSRDHICLYEPKNGWLFTGDLFCGKRNIYLRRDEIFLQMLADLKKVSSMDVKTVFCSLKGIIPDGKKALKEKIKFMEEIQGRVIEMHEQGVSPATIRKQILGHEDIRLVVTNRHFAKQYIIDEILEGYGHDQY